MTSAEPVRPATTTTTTTTTGIFGTSRVQASVLASYQLVEDARRRTPERVRKRQRARARARARAEQVIAVRKVAREFERDERPAVVPTVVPPELS